MDQMWTTFTEHPSGIHVLVYRIDHSRREGPFTLLDQDGEIFTILMPAASGLTKFRSTVVNPYLQLAVEGISGAPVTQYENNGPRVFLAHSQSHAK